MKLDKTSAEIATTRTLQFKAEILPSNATDQKVTWTSSNTSIATVDQKGLVKAQKYGKVTITAKSSNGKTAKCTIQTRFNDVNYSGKVRTTSSAGGLS